jgi:hypothetical protein
MLSVGLGLAFRGRPEAVLKIGAVPAVADSLRQERGLDVTTMDETAGRDALRMGRVALMVDRAAERTPRAALLAVLTWSVATTLPPRVQSARKVPDAHGTLHSRRSAPPDIVFAPSRASEQLDAVWGSAPSSTRRRKLTRLMAANVPHAHWARTHLATAAVPCRSGASDCLRRDRCADPRIDHITIICLLDR